MVKFNDTAKHPSIQRVKPQLVNLKIRKPNVRNLACNHTFSAYLREIAHAAQKTVGNTRRAA